MNTKICMIVFSYYPSDPRVRREAEALVDAGCEVDVICLQNANQLKQEVINKVGIHRLPVQRKRGSKFRYIWEYISFIYLSFLKVNRLFISKKYDVVHIHNMPDILVLSAIMPRLFGSKIILDLHDPMPEVYMTKYSIGFSHPIIRILLLLEKLSISLASIVLTPNLSFQKVFTRRSCSKDKVHVIMNSPDEKVFTTNYSECKSDNQYQIMYHGTIVERHGLATALDAVALLKDRIPNLIFHIYGEGDYVESILDIIKKKQLNDFVYYHGFVDLEQIAKDIKYIDLGIIPNLRTPFTEINMPTRVFEYLSMNKPVVAPKTQGILDYFTEDSLYFFESGNAESLANTIWEAYINQEKTQELLSKGIRIYKNYRWELEKKKLVELVKELNGDLAAA